MKGKRCVAGLVVLLVILVAGAAGAQMNPGPFNVLHKQGAIWNSSSGGWDFSAYYAMEWAVDFLYNSQGVSILHQDGAVWNGSTSGWDFSGYYSGTNYATALEYLRDLEGCWGMQITDFETYDSGGGIYVLDRETEVYPNASIEIDWQTGTRFGGEIMFNDTEDGCGYIFFEGTIIGDHFTAVGHNIESFNGSCEVIDVITGLVFWNDVEARWELKGSYVGADLECDDDTEAGFFGAFIAWPETTCECPGITIITRG